MDKPAKFSMGTKVRVIPHTPGPHESDWNGTVGEEGVIDETIGRNGKYFYAVMSVGAWIPESALELIST